tara:strand:+ start:91 stop:552 length:462 start_codon:yes stop_codon:yes gene_type:complete
MSNKEYDSIFSPKKKIDISSHITELILNNKIEWHNKKNGVDGKPRCDFWVKDKADSNPEYKQLQKDFRLEVTYVKNLLKIFSSITVLKYVKDRGIITLRYLDLDKQKTVIYNMYQEEIKRIKNQKDKIKKKKSPDPELNFSKKPSKSTKVSGL